MMLNHRCELVNDMASEMRSHAVGKLREIGRCYLQIVMGRIGCIRRINAHDQNRARNGRTICGATMDRKC